MAYARGLTGPELGAPQFPECDRFMGALPLAEPFAALDANDVRMVDTLNVMEELGTSVSAVRELEEARKKKGLSTDDAWFWNCYVILPKASHNANIYLLQDDVPNFLRFWMNSYAAMVGADGKLWEALAFGQLYGLCSAPDNGTAGWFMENFRNLLVMEDGQSLWVARATPRVWLEQGKKIAVKNAPTYFGHFGLRDRLGRGQRQDHRHHRDTVSQSAHRAFSCASAIPKAVADQERDGQRQAVDRFRPGEGDHPLARRAGFDQGGGGLLTLPFTFGEAPNHLRS